MKKDDEYLISVIIPVYNKEKFLERSILSVLNQTYTNFEVILINDGSTDNSLTIIEMLAAKDKRIRYVSQINQGVSVARNKGIELARGKYISFLDADDTYKSAFLENMIENIQNCDVCYCGHYFVENEVTRKSKLKFTNIRLLEKYLYNKCCPHTNSWLIKKELIKNNDIKFSEDINWGEDMLFFAKVLLHTKDIKHVKKYMTHYYVDQDGCLSQNNMSKVDKDIIWVKKLKEYILTKGIVVPEALKALETYRLPALILYRIWLNKNTVDVKEYYEKYQEYIDKVKFTNGLRSLKVFIYRLKIKRLIKNKDNLI